MGIYNNICYKVEDVIVKIITKKQDTGEVQQKVMNYRKEVADERAKRRMGK